ncbi:MAG TPA: DUF2914 domain-containing protein [Thermoanaerobaculia bacterium]|jgi:hypothetical protein
MSDRTAEPSPDAERRSSLISPRSSFTRAKRYAPAIAFFGGFAWDALTLGQSIKSTDLFILLGYLAGAAAILVALGRGLTFRGSRYLNTVLQFFFGGIFSALFIFYFLSSSDLPGYLVVLILGGLLIGNEFLQNRYSELTVSWAFFTMSAIMFFNFALAHLFRSISTVWFYLGTLVAVLLVLALRQISRGERSSVKPSFAVAALMLVLHAFNAIPPVPLVKKEMLIAHEVRRSAAGYTARVESSPLRFWRSSAGTFHRGSDQRVYCFTSVFIPNGIATTIRHRWQQSVDGGWREMGVVPFRIEGGRTSGYRGYTYKSNVTAGKWRVIAESESGAAIGIVTFRVVEGTAKTRTIKL